MRPAPLDYLARAPLRVWFAATLVFLYLPIAVMIVFSFNTGKRSIWRGFTLDWYRALAADTELLVAFANSLAIAAISTALSLVLGTLAALLLWRWRGHGSGRWRGHGRGRWRGLGRPLLEAGFALPIIVPEICLGVAFLVFFTAILPWPPELPWPLDLGATIIAHTSLSFSFVALVVRARLASFDPALADAARDLGAGEARVLADIVLPHLVPALIAGALLAFTLSLDDFVITFFTAGPDTITFPVKLYAMVRFSVTPEVNAASTILILVTTTLTALALRTPGAAVAGQAPR